MTMPARNSQRIHPGELLLQEFVQPPGISQYRLAKDTSGPPRRINEIVHARLDSEVRAFRRAS